MRLGNTSEEFTPQYIEEMLLIADNQPDGDLNATYQNFNIRLNDGTGNEIVKC